MICSFVVAMAVGLRILNTVLINLSRQFNHILLCLLSVLHNGHVLIIAFFPLYHVLTHSSHTTIFLQHLATMTGGFNGVP